MKTDEVVKLLRHYRHDLLNDLQIIQGYASMGNMDKLKEKLSDILEKTNEERKLANLACPHFILWLMKFNSTYNNFRLTYSVDINGNFSDIDLSLYATFQEIMQLLHIHYDQDTLYKGELNIFEETSPKIVLTFNGPFHNIEKLKQNIKGKLFVEEAVVTKESFKVILAMK